MMSWQPQRGQHQSPPISHPRLGTPIQDTAAGPRGEPSTTWRMHCCSIPPTSQPVRGSGFSHRETETRRRPPMRSSRSSHLQQRYSPACSTPCMTASALFTRPGLPTGPDGSEWRAPSCWPMATTSEPSRPDPGIRSQPILPTQSSSEYCHGHRERRMVGVVSCGQQAESPRTARRRGCGLVVAIRPVGRVGRNASCPRRPATVVTASSFAAPEATQLDGIEFSDGVVRHV